MFVDDDVDVAVRGLLVGINTFNGISMNDDDDDEEEDSDSSLLLFSFSFFNDTS